MLAEFLKEKRLGVGLSQGEVAKELGFTSPQMISNFERDLSYPPAKALKTLAKLYKCDDLITVYTDAMTARYRKKLELKIQGKKLRGA